MGSNNTRTYRYKKPVMEFFCPLCGTSRAFVSKPRLSSLNYLQIAIVSLFLMWPLFSLMKERVFFVPFIVWILFEFFVRILFRRQVPCPECGFDASWYKRDVKMARQKVRDFWAISKEAGKVEEKPLTENQ